MIIQRTFRIGTSRIRLGRSACARVLTTNASAPHLDQNETAETGSTASSAEQRPPGPQHASKYDVVIVGGGLVGATLACCLGTSRVTRSLRVAVLEPRPISDHRILPEIPDARVSAITPATARLFKDLGVWKAIHEARCTPFSSMQVWEHGGPGYIRYDAAEVGADALGYIVENKVMQLGLYDRLRELTSVHLVSPISFTTVALGSDSYLSGSHPATGAAADPKHDDCPTWSTLYLSDGSSIKARLVVGADGSRSRVRAAAEIRPVVWTYDQKAVIATVVCDQHSTTAWQRFLPDGPLALLPLSERYSNVVWSTTPTHAEELLSMDDGQFASAVMRALNDAPANSASLPFNFLPRGSAADFVMPPVVQAVAGRRQAFPLASSYATTYVGPRLALIGDAAHTVHPLAGQGVNLGYSDAECLAGIIEEGLLAGADIGAESVLKRYERGRMMTNLSMVGGLHVLKSVFGASWLPFAAARNVGLGLVNMIGPLKRQIIRYAAGDLSNDRRSTRQSAHR